jgi:type IV pilus assembly protein PilN
MIRINLLPVKTSKKRETALRQLFGAGIGLVLVLGGIAYAHMSISSQVETAAQKNQELQEEIDRLKQVIGQVEEFEKKKQALQQKLDIIKTLKSKKTGPVHMLDEIATNIPDKCWITSIQEANRKVTLTGTAVNNEVVADFISKLDLSMYFDDVYLVSTKQVTSPEGIKLKEFSLTALMTTPEEKKGQVEAVGEDIEGEDGG